MKTSPANFCNRSGFTLIEMIGVVCIMGILVAILLPTIQRAIQYGQKARAQADIESLGTALRMYESDLGLYPSNTATNAATFYHGLGQQIASGPPLNITVGPYMEFRTKDLNSGKVFLDPWRNPYVYTSRDGATKPVNNTQSFDIYSCGPDGAPGDVTDIISVAGQGDDVKNW